jgi:hypothetical protein
MERKVVLSLTEDQVLEKILNRLYDEGSRANIVSDFAELTQLHGSDKAVQLMVAKTTLVSHASLASALCKAGEHDAEHLVRSVIGGVFEPEVLAQLKEELANNVAADEFHGHGEHGWSGPVAGDA